MKYFFLKKCKYKMATNSITAEEGQRIINLSTVSKYLSKIDYSKTKTDYTELKAILNENNINGATNTVGLAAATKLDTLLSKFDQATVDANQKTYKFTIDSKFAELNNDDQPLYKYIRQAIYFKDQWEYSNYVMYAYTKDLRKAFAILKKKIKLVLSKQATITADIQTKLTSAGLDIKDPNFAEMFSQLKGLAEDIKALHAPTQNSTGTAVVDNGTPGIAVGGKKPKRKLTKSKKGGFVKSGSLMPQNFYEL